MTLKIGNIIALLAGLFVANLLWQYYLKPKYDIRSGNEEVLSALYQEDVRALNEATNQVDGQVLFKSTDAAAADDNQENTNYILSAKNTMPENFNFNSSANKPKDMFQLANDGAKRKDTAIRLNAANNKMPKVKPITQPVLSGIASDASTDTSADADGKERFTMFVAPVKYHLIKSGAEYNSFRAKNRGKYPAVNFTKNMIIFLESAGNLANGFFVIESVAGTDSTVALEYKVNILGADTRSDTMPYKIIKRSDKKIILKQVK